MKAESTETLEQRLSRLRKITEQTRSSGILGEVLAERIEGDLYRLMNSAWLNCYEFLQMNDKSRPDHSIVMKEAVDYALSTDMGLLFLKFWREGNTEELRKLWPDAPDSPFVAECPEGPVLSGQAMDNSSLKR